MINKYIWLLIVILFLCSPVSAVDERIKWNEDMVGANHATKADTLNRLGLIEHNIDGTHKAPYSGIIVEHNSDGTHKATNVYTDLITKAPLYDSRSSASVNAAVSVSGGKSVGVYIQQQLSSSLTVLMPKNCADSIVIIFRCVNS